MSHVREQLAVALVTRLTGLTTTGGRVYRQRPEEYALQPNELPALRIFLLGDSAQSQGIGTPFYDRTTRVRIEGVVQMALGAPAGTNPVDTKLNLIASEVETALASPLVVGTTQLYLYYQGCAFDSSGAGDQPVAVIGMQFEVVLMTQHGLPDTLLQA